MVETKEMPLTIYGLLARRHNTDNDYVYQVVNGIRKGRWGKGAAILADWNKLKDSFDDWITEYKADGSMIVNMEDIHVSVYVQNGIARIYKRTDLMNEADVRNMNLDAFRDFLNGVTPHKKNGVLKMENYANILTKYIGINHRIQNRKKLRKKWLL